MLFVKGVTEVL